jgi:hypothetical protein
MQELIKLVTKLRLALSVVMTREDKLLLGFLLCSVIYHPSWRRFVMAVEPVCGDVCVFVRRHREHSIIKNHVFFLFFFSVCARRSFLLYNFDYIDLISA